MNILAEFVVVLFVCYALNTGGRAQEQSEGSPVPANVTTGGNSTREVPTTTTTTTTTTESPDVEDTGTATGTDTGTDGTAEGGNATDNITDAGNTTEGGATRIGSEFYKHFYAIFGLTLVITLATSSEVFL